MLHARLLVVVGFALLVTGCANTPSENIADGGAPDATVDASTSLGAADAGVAPSVPTQRSLALRCKLISDSHLDDPTANGTHQRANLRGTDLGISVAHEDELYLFFGDTAGAQTIWPLGPESLPDAVGYSAVPASTVATNPEVLCTQLRFLLTGGATGGADGDFAAAYMRPPAGHSIAEFIHNPSGPRGTNAFPNLPGDFEVPSGAFSYGGSIYLFYTTIHQDPFEMRGSYLARWATPSTEGLPNYDILYGVDQRFDESGALRGDFINIAPLVVDDYLYIYGTGQYRSSAVHLARKRLEDLPTPGGFERYDAAAEAWVEGAVAAAPIVAEPAIGELSVRYYAAIDRYVMLDQEVSAGNRIAARFADAPEGPWSAPVTVAAMGDPEFAARHCCEGTDCSGERLFQCDRAGFYGTYMLPEVVVHPDGAFSISFLVSTWVPYNVALMTATFE